MKHFFLFTLLLSAFSQIHGQQESVTVKNGTLSSRSNYSNVDSYYAAFNGETIILTDETKGSPYVNPNYQLGAIIKDGEVVVNNLALRYNAYNDIIIGKKTLATDNSKALNVIKSPQYKIRIGKDTYTAVLSKSSLGQSQYYQIIHPGEVLTLYKKYECKYQERIQATTSMTRDAPASFKMRSAYFMGDADGNMKELPSSKKKVAKLFGANEAKVKQFIKKNKINLSKEEGLKELMDFCNTL